ncbi:MAG: LysR family transcriptional regulator [Eubacterium sp.]|nr:LysR family transcriptional regulator [Eubacterium sp.]
MLRQIKYFQAVVKNNSFSEAAAECNISQSAISQQMKSLEQELGIELLERKNRKFTLTPAGEHFYKKSLVLVADFEQMCRETNRIAHKENEGLKIGYLRCYSGQEFQIALDLFAEKYPDIPVEIYYGNHDELYDMLRKGIVDIVFNDQRRAFSDEYVNMLLTTSESYIEIAARNPLAGLDRITVQELKNIPCILVSSEAEKAKEQEFYRNVIGFQGEIIFADNMETARISVIGGKGFMPSEGTPIAGSLGTNIKRIPLHRGDSPITRNYCAFWKKENANAYAGEFAEILRNRF